MRRLSTPSCSAVNTGCRGQLTRGDKRLGWISAECSDFSEFGGEGCEINDEDGSFSGFLKLEGSPGCPLSSACASEILEPVKSNDSSSAEVEGYYLRLIVIENDLTKSKKVYSGLVSSNIKIVVQKSAFFESQLC